MKARAILVTERLLNKRQCDCFVTNHTCWKKCEPKEFTGIWRRTRLMQAVMSEDVLSSNTISQCEGRSQRALGKLRKRFSANSSVSASVMGQVPFRVSLLTKDTINSERLPVGLSSIEPSSNESIQRACKRADRVLAPGEALRAWGNIWRQIPGKLNAMT